ncbi:signal peptidase I [Tissierella praeacuta]|uniref:signal peptidase I n=1 Tax=Tissierella praeacuta TaxID=43131 RepID=UPI003DA5EFB4
MKKVLKEIFGYIVSVLVALFIVNLVGYNFVLGESMLPTLNNHDILFANKIKPKLHDIKRGDIVVFNSSFKTNLGLKKKFVKRVIGISGDNIIIKDGEVYLNDTLLDEPYINGDYTDGYINATVPENKVFVMGDNRGNSLDSRRPEVGFVNLSDINSVLPFRLYPFDNFGKVK